MPGNLVAQAVGLTIVTILLVCARLFGLELPVWVSVPGHIGSFFAIALGCRAGSPSGGRRRRG